MPYIGRTQNGKNADIAHAIFPIFKIVKGVHKLIGTAFFITKTGLFVTAKHVLSDVFDKNGSQLYPILGLQLFGNNQYIRRPVLRCCSNAKSDVTVGVLAPVTHNRTGDHLLNKILTLTTKVPKVSSRIVTYAYPKTTVFLKNNIQKIDLTPEFYDGELEEYLPSGRDSFMIPFPCYRGNIKLLGGASGGPTMDDKGRVFGINCTGYDGTNISYFARINEILPLWVDDVNLDATHRKKVSVRELIDKKHIQIDPLLPMKA